MAGKLKRAYQANVSCEAYVFVEEAKIKNGPYKWEITFQIRNFGQTPAHRISLEYAVGAIDWPDDDATPKLPTPWKPENLGSMAPRRFCFEKVDDLQCEEATLEEITNHTKAIYLLGTITYETVFGTRFRTKFRYYVGGDIDWDGPGEMNADEDGNSAE